jgi:hypothetical protein
MSRLELINSLGFETFTWNDNFSMYVHLDQIMQSLLAYSILKGIW